ncbi:hypothetical protein SESBI_02602 [Sesbania bispinosa]|nr:hypothetical protein SESBI_02602 [Sesbania bispinosa]
MDGTVREEGDGDHVGLSAEEADNLVRNNKEQKHVSFPEPLLVESQTVSLVKESPLQESLPQADSVQMPKDLFPTTTSLNFLRGVVSYKDIFIGANEGSEHESDSGCDSFSSDSGDEDNGDEDQIDEELLSLWDPGCPIVKISKKEKKSICIPWKRTVIIKLLGKRVGYKMLQNRLYKLWHPSSGMEIIDLENEYFLVRFSNTDDYNHFIEHGLSVEYYDRKILWRIGDTLGHTIKIDNNTLREKSCWAGRYKVGYEGLHMVCFECGMYDHQRDTCSLLKSGSEKEQTEVEGPTVTTEQVVPPAVTNVKAMPDEGFGPWMLVQRGGRRGFSKPEAAGADSPIILEAQEGSTAIEKVIPDSQDQSNHLVHEKSQPPVTGFAHLRKQRTRASVRIEKKVVQGNKTTKVLIPVVQVNTSQRNNNRTTKLRNVFAEVNAAGNPRKFSKKNSARDAP